MRHCDTGELFRKCGIRPTRKKAAVLAGIMESDSPLAARDLFFGISKNMKIDLATVYRALTLFCSKGIVRKFAREGEELFEMSCIHNPLHPHFTCTECRQVVCLPALGTEDTEMITKRAGNLNVNGISIVFSGVCEKCVMR